MIVEWRRVKSTQSMHNFDYFFGDRACPSWGPAARLQSACKFLQIKDRQAFSDGFDPARKQGSGRGLLPAYGPPYGLRWCAGMAVCWTPSLIPEFGSSGQKDFFSTAVRRVRLAGKLHVSIRQRVNQPASFTIACNRRR